MHQFYMSKQNFVLDHTPYDYQEDQINYDPIKFGTEINQQNMVEYCSSALSNPMVNTYKDNHMELPEPVNFDTEKLKGKRNCPMKKFALENYMKPYINNTEKVKLERNRICARECRMRRKEQIKNMESQLKELRIELDICRKELNKYKEKEEQNYFSYFDVKDAFPVPEKPDLNVKEGNNAKKLLNNDIVFL